MAAKKPEQPTTRERRFLQTTVESIAPVEGEAEGSVITGHAATFGQVADLWWFDETIAPGAFRDSAATDDVVFVFNHDLDLILGRTKSGTLKLSEDEKGLRYELSLPDTTLGRDVRELVRRGDLNAMSFSFDPLEEEVNHELERPLRTLKKVRLFDVSLVTHPAYEGTSVDLRSQAEALAAVWKAGQERAIQEAQGTQEERIRRLRLRARALAL